MPGPFFAHTKAGSPSDQWELLEVHLRDVSARAGTFGEALGCGSIAQVIGLWHDLGKYSAAFQAYLHATTDDDGHEPEVRGRIDHSSAGAQHAMATLGRIDPTLARLVAYCIAGHHSGLLNAGTPADADVPGNLAHRLAKRIEPVDAAPAPLLHTPTLAPPALRFLGPSEAPFQLSGLGRMLFSCLVDADFLATEAFLDPQRAGDRVSRPPDWLAWANRVDQLVRRKQQAAASPVNDHRARIYDACLRAARQAPGFFSLTVPTGGGKTLASFAFSCRHAQAHGLGRVIYALPYTSIIEQNAMVLRDVLGPDADLLLEHHSNLDPARETSQGRLASENWDAPLIVTTNVQLLESLFAARPSACRKLHRLARSVIILDEAQALPIELLRPCLAALSELVRNYGVSIVLCTATQPALHRRPDFPIGLEGVREIVTDPPPAQLFESMRRVRVTPVGELTTADLAQRVATQERVLCVVDTRARAAELYRAVRAIGVEAIHLSAAMCPAHRSPLIAQVKTLLAQGRPCRVISTQLIEAGVDVDFPVVYRSLAGLDAIAQAAGRCNREGRLPMGQVFVFIPEGGLPKIPRGHLRTGAHTAAEILPDFPDPLGLDAIQRYFELRYWKSQDDWDAHGVMPCFRGGKTPAFDYATAAERFKMIASDQRPVVVPWSDEGERLVSGLLHQPLPAWRQLRLAQRYSVQIPERIWAQLVDSGEIRAFDDRPSVLLLSHRYTADMGLSVDEATLLSAEKSVY